MIKISIVEDTKEIREVLATEIDNEPDMEIISQYANAETAIGGILLNRPDLVIMDIGLPEMKGTKCMMLIKSHYEQIKFLMFTVFDDDNNVFEALEAGADGYILKRESIEKIIKAIREVLSGGAPMSRTIAKKVFESFRKEKPLVKKKEWEQLTLRQTEILELLSKGYRYNKIGLTLKITEGTVKQHIHQIYRKLQVNNRTEAINKWLG